ncbi:Heat shock protein GrpE [hydrothermal vent metagenome]|uniref:Heat shock protein GrpE n=1 Tax=hydrothermal vent metagenome TaxID=652676 RepID=A0A3B0RI40_9ZZZZ
MSDHDYPPNKDQNPVEGDKPVDLTEDDRAVADEIASASQSDAKGDAKKGDADKSLRHERQLAELNDRVLRLAAELENTRRRSEREKADAGRYAIANFARDLLGVTDNFERALHAAGGDDTPTSTEALSGIVAGLQMTEKELLAVMERHGIRRVFPKGEKFDPNLHQAVAQIPDGAVPVGHVIDVAQPGFTIGDRVLRAAMVTVSSGAGGYKEEGDDAEPGSRFNTRA